MKLALRSLLRSPGYTLVALFTLALGIGVNTSMFSLIDALMFRSGPFPRSQEIHQVVVDTRQGPRYSHAETEAREIREKSSAFRTLTLVRWTSSAFAQPGRPAEQVNSVMASADFFDTFGVQPFLGRAFTAEETQPGRNQVIVLSYAFWQQHFSGDREVIGRALRIDGESVTVIGVMPASFDWQLYWGSIAFWRPLNFTTDQLENRASRAFHLVGRLHPGTTSAQATAELAPLASIQLKEYPQHYNGLSYRVITQRDAMMDRESRVILYMLLGLSGFVLLLACANLANLQLARATTALRDFAIRAALGASRARLILQQLTECLLLSLSGGALGLLGAWWLNRVLMAAIRIGEDPNGLELAIDAKILAIAFVVAACTGVLFGIVPAWLSSRADLVTALKSQSRGSTSGRGQHRMRQALIVAEVTLALVLLGGAGVMQRGFEKFVRKDVGWDTTRVLTGALPLPESRYLKTEDKVAFYRQVQTRLAALPGVEAAALSTGIPIWGYGTNRKIHTEKQDASDQANLPLASHVMITPDYFRVIGVRLLAGREFPVDVKPNDPPVVIVNESLARQFWPGQSALGQRIASINSKETVWSEVIGVVSDTESAANIGNQEVTAQIFRPLAQEAWNWVRVVIRAQQPSAHLESVRRVVAEIDPDLPVDDLEPVTTSVARSQHNMIIVVKLLEGFAALGLVLAAVGLYGVISNLVAQRTGEFGIRMALGAKPGDVLGLVLRHGVKLTALGLLLGFGGAYGLSRLLNSTMPRLVDSDLATLGMMAAVLFAVAIAACWLPARRATKVDPMIALRSE